MNSNITRRDLLAAAAALGIAPAIALGNESETMMTRSIPASGETLPVVGLGTYDVFDVASTPAEIDLRRQIVDILTAKGGSLIDTSPMYNRSEKVIGDVIEATGNRDALFLATKVWTNGEAAGIAQMKRSAELMQTEVIDLMQVHNLRDTDAHMGSIRALKADGQIRYSGLTHYTAGGHAALVREMRRYKPDFIQINYSLGEREAENEVLPAARDLGVAVIINRPFQAGRLFRAVSGQSVPDWASAFASSWGQFFLKFIISHPAVTCVIPATSKTHHMVDNAGAGTGDLPDADMRDRMIAFISDL